jgi:mono/diheme cytochrome c family protein
VKPSLNWRNLGLPVYAVIGLLIAFALFFLFELLTFDPASVAVAPEPVSEIAYLDVVDPLLVNADAARGAQLVVSYACTACHREGAANGVAPAFTGVAARAAQRRPPMTARAYIYESIVNPSAYVVENYPNSMLQNLRDRLTDQELGDIIAYLLSEDAY